ncbi:3-oxoacyl-[acyl-carrier-protein] synthase, KASIII [Candidatus Burkholderia verschuerenii]|uniref:3-oxoacyl-[acyl-carrier-protein] synthase, KASIII n=1 Tax=Candidatus Burkholderia verschuerenii TaxID=242163 RepID=A0A0L0MEP7_9BURK|nr:ketoacyl-ACP synthase III [Candidatus Burkholderia verschuerenii]KND60776.1 3-oxoacyl-[acyl-carrier-protein] synthase, KASIII [Candidatus Burkholderia verschuerenii]
MGNLLTSPDVFLNGIVVVPGARTEHNDASALGIPDANYERIVRKVGVRSRPVAGPDQYTSDLAFSASRALLDARPQTDVGALIVCTQTPDHLIPGVSSRVHGLLGLPNDCFVIDINQGCSGFVLGTQMIVAMQRSMASHKSSLLINADTYSRLLRPDDVTTRVLFGDAATAAEFSTRPQGLRFRYCRSFADGTGYEAFVAHNSAVRPDDQPAGIHMDGSAIFNFALRCVPDAIRIALDDNGLQVGQIRKFIFHQANRFVTAQLARKLGLSDNQAPDNCEYMGNTVSRRPCRFCRRNRWRRSNAAIW